MKYKEDWESKGLVIEALRSKRPNDLDHRDYFSTGGMQIALLIRTKLNGRPWWIWQDK